MLLTVSTTYQPATHLGFLLHKHPAKVQSFPQNFGTVHIFYPEATKERCTAALLLDIDPIKLTRKGKGGGFALQPYVNDRPYVASSFLSVAMAQVLTNALKGECKDVEELVETPLPLEVTVASLPCRGGESIVRNLFEPLGYKLKIQTEPLDPKFPDWGQSRYITLTLEHTTQLYKLLRHLYILIPVLDNDKHYWVDEHEVEKLLKRGEGWLAEHPEKELIARRYLKYKGSLAKAVLMQLEPELSLEEDKESIVEECIGLHQQRLETVAKTLVESGASRVLDLGCGEGKLIKTLLKNKQFTEIVGVDISSVALEKAKDRFSRLPEHVSKRLKLMQGSLLYRDKRLENYDAAALIEVIEHLDLARLPEFEQVIFAHAKPKLVIVTTPNSEYNVMWEQLSAGKFRHSDHRFEWTRAEFKIWAEQVADTYDYEVSVLPLGEEDNKYGAPSQMAVFKDAYPS